MTAMPVRPRCHRGIDRHPRYSEPNGFTPFIMFHSPSGGTVLPEPQMGARQTTQVDGLIGHRSTSGGERGLAGPQVASIGRMRTRGDLNPDPVAALKDGTDRPHPYRHLAGLPRGNLAKMLDPGAYIGADSAFIDVAPGDVDVRRAGGRVKTDRLLRWTDG